MEGLEGGSQLLGAPRGHPGELEGRSKHREERQGRGCCRMSSAVAALWFWRVKVKCRAGWTPTGGQGQLGGSLA